MWDCGSLVATDSSGAVQESLQNAVSEAAEGVPEIARNKGVVALKHEIERLRVQCNEQLQRQRFLDNQRAELQSPE